MTFFSRLRGEIPDIFGRRGNPVRDFGLKLYLNELYIEIIFPTLKSENMHNLKQENVKKNWSEKSCWLKIMPQNHVFQPRDKV